MTRGPVQVIGAGGHAKVAIATLLDQGHEVVAVWDDAPAKHGTSLLGVPVRGAIAGAVAHGDVPAVLAIGDNRARAALAARLPLTWATAVHPTAYVNPSVRLGPGTVVFAGAVIQPDTVIGAHAIVNTGATVDHDCVLGDFVHLGPGVHLCGGVTVGEGALLGVAACARPGARVGAWAIVGAGAAVVAAVHDGAIVVGVPARLR